MYKLLIIFTTILIVSGCAGNKHKTLAEDMELAEHFYNRALYSEAERILLGLRDTMPENYDIHFRLGNIYVRTGQFPAAESMYRKCIDLNPEEPKGWYNLSLLRVKQAIAISEQGSRKTALTDANYSRQFVMLREGLITAITGK
ncbi:tetratricopeptide repeat protein [Microbulbifer bruguierae]|uniref:Tetratricopeptide repeat protein n=1 Tax=Microbulbifer bruguierae TaxID=3029061 RepID=A0ABY8N9D1_9GAMM|nr:tetratricopeptide repeat protein [Microbulbifer bruguierae]WGL15418.1 tetratricopeptide repeat protein [Microbulbifer bruguierae]